MEDARTIILPPRAAVGDGPGLHQALELLVASCGARAAELVIRVDGGSGEHTVRVGEPHGRTREVEVEVSPGGAAVLRLSGGRRPAPPVLGLFSAMIGRELDRLRLLAERAVLRAAVEATDAAVMVFGPDGAIVFANRAADALLDRQTSDLLMASRNGGRPEPVFRLLCAEVGRLLGAPERRAWKERIELTDGSELAVELSLRTTGADGLGRVVLAVLREAVGPPDRRVDEYASRHRLSPREREVLQLLVKGLDTDSLADRLGISPHTVRDHLKNVFRKTSSRSRSELLSALTGASSQSAR